MTLGIDNGKDLLEALTFLVAILGGLAGAVLFLVKHRKAAIAQARTELVRAWTNEGDVSSKDRAFIDLRLSNMDGDIIGTIQASEQQLEVHTNVGWRATTLTISEYRGRSGLFHIATARVRVTGNSNRLEWRLVGIKYPDFLPVSTTLWSDPRSEP
ncbi:hypothetical protein [Lysobacter terrae]